MGALSYAVPGLVLSESPAFSAQVQALQRDMRSLGYGAGPIDGIFGPGTAANVRALQYDLMNNTGASSSNDGQAPVAIRNYNDGSVSALTGSVAQGLVACIAAMLADPAYPKLPFSANPAADNAAALAAVSALPANQVPIPFLLAILNQESNSRHYQVPEGANIDAYVTVGLDRNNTAQPSAITSRGYGIGQYTLFHHPPTAAEVAGFIVNPVQNVSQALAELLGKFQNYILGATPDTQADDRIAEVAANTPLRICQYAAGDPRYLTGCAACLGAAGTVNIQAGVTPVYAGAPLTYAQTQYHEGSYQNVPVRANIPCDWAYAVRRYNGSGVNSYDYQAEVLLRIVSG
jgi:peptidoglycan hydrolase-like protein with peptidoglycan-binding domain